MPGGAAVGLAHDQRGEGYDTASLPRVSTEMSLHVLAYNLKRMMNLVGTKPLMEAIRA